MEPFITSGTLSQWTWALWGYRGRGARCPLEGQFLWFWRFEKKKIPGLRWTALGTEGVYAVHRAALTTVRKRSFKENHRRCQPSAAPQCDSQGDGLSFRRHTPDFPKKIKSLWNEKKIRTVRSNHIIAINYDCEGPAALQSKQGNSL